MSNSQSRRARRLVPVAIGVMASLTVFLLLARPTEEPAHAFAATSSAAVGEATEVYELQDGDFVEVRVLFDSSQTTGRVALAKLGVGFPVAGEGQVAAQYALWRQWDPDRLPLPVAYYAGQDKDNPSARNAVQWAIGVWNTVPNSTFRFLDAGITPAGGLCTRDGFRRGDGINTVGYSYVLEPGTLGVTCSYAPAKNADGVGRAVEFDIELNGRTDWSVSDETSDGRFDLNSVVLHEMGHALGLDHSDVPGAVMLPSIGAGQRRTKLTVDDIAAVQALYTQYKLSSWSFCRSSPSCPAGAQPVVVGANAYLAFSVDPPPTAAVRFEASWDHSRLAKDTLPPTTAGSGTFNLKADALGPFATPGLLSVQVWVGTKSAGIMSAEVLPPDFGPAGLSLTVEPVSVGGRDRLLASARVKNVSDRDMPGIPVTFAASGDGCSYSFPHDLISDVSGGATWMVDAKTTAADTWCTITASAGSYTSVYPVRIRPREVPVRGAHVIVVPQISRE